MVFTSRLHCARLRATDHGVGRHHRSGDFGSRDTPTFRAACDADEASLITANMVRYLCSASVPGDETFCKLEEEEMRPWDRFHTVCNATLINVHPSKSPDMNIPSITAELRRRRFLAGTLTGAVGGLGALFLSSCSTNAASADHAHPTASAAPPSPAATPPNPATGATVEPLATNADQALQLLRDGNQRFADDRAEHVDDNLARRMAVSSTQKPFATILSCVDSRVPIELIFDRGIGDLVVIRSAGEVLDRSVVGSLEFGVAELNTPLLMVLGHQRCGALTAAVKAFDTHETQPGDLEYLIDALAPAVRQVAGQPGDRVTNAVKVNVALTVAQLRKSAVLAQAESTGKAKIIGAYYSVDTGKVDVLDG
jgi:carbonic anhydrase